MNRARFTIVCWLASSVLLINGVHADADTVNSDRQSSGTWYNNSLPWVSGYGLTLNRSTTSKKTSLISERSWLLFESTSDRITLLPRKARVQRQKPIHAKQRAKFGWEEHDDAQYATFRSRGNVYFKGKAGYLWDEEVDDLSDMSFGEWMDSLDTKGAVGVGAGYTLSNGETLEFEYTINKKDEKILSIGYTF